MVHHAPSMQHRTTASKMLALLLNLACTSFKLLIISSPGKPLGILGFSGAADDEQLLHLDLSAPDGSAVLQDAHDLSEAHRPNPKKGDVPQKTAVREERLRRETRTTFHAGLPEGSTVHQKEHPKWLTAGASEQVSAHVPDDSSRTGGSLLLQIQDALFDRESLEDTVADTKDWKIMKLIMGQQGRRHRVKQGRIVICRIVAPFHCWSWYRR